MAEVPQLANAALMYEGRVFGGYRVARAIAAGGMATVFLARKTGPGRFAQNAAIKIIHPHLSANRDLVSMFMEEARLAACVNHPNVCRVLEFGEAEGTLFLAMEYVRGESWDTTLRALRADVSSGARIAPVAAYVLAQAAEGLHAVHEAVDPSGKPLHIVHRDVSPHNLLLGYDGSVRVLDFGVAYAADRSRAAQTDILRGRFPYMAPEQLRDLDVDRRADVWSLGVMLREALTQDGLFARDTQIATMLAVTQEPMAAWPASVPEGLRAIADRALARDPAERFEDARSMGVALMQYLSDAGEVDVEAELSSFMRSAFANRISDKRRMLREIAGDDASLTLTPSSPALRFEETTASLTTLRAPARRRWSRAMWIGVSAVLFVASALGAWFAVRVGRDQAQHALPSSHSASVAAEPAHGTAPSSANVAPEVTPPARAPQELADAATPRGAGAPVVDEGAMTTMPTSNTQDAAADTHAARVERRRQRRLRRQEAAALSTSNTEVPTSSGAAGTVVIGAKEGWAEIYLDGRRLGTTPLRTQLSAGPKVLEVRPYGTVSAQEVRVEVVADETTKVRLDL